MTCEAHRLQARDGENSLADAVMASLILRELQGFGLQWPFFLAVPQCCCGCCCIE
jgi:hypothetical protein